jgi:hypothetical protein
MTIRDAFLWMAERQIGHPYRWGGDDPLAGFDCSGLVLECGKSVGLYPSGFDTTAAGLYADLNSKGKVATAQSRPGCLAFWSMSDESKIHHVEIVWRGFDNLSIWQCIGAAGGGSKTLTVADAIAQNAYVKVRPLSTRGMNLFLADPFI